MIKLDGVCKSHNEQSVLNNLSLCVNPAGRVALMGESGVGKTTVLRLICGLDLPDSGKVEVNGKISAVFQEDRLFSHLTVYQNVYIICKNEKKTKDALEGVLLWEDRDKYPHELSGGMARRVAIARALAFEHDILILDEPFKGLDESTRERVISFIQKNEKSNTLVMVTHDKLEAELMDADIIIL